MNKYNKIKNQLKEFVVILQQHFLPCNVIFVKNGYIPTSIVGIMFANYINVR